MDQAKKRTIKIWVLTAILVVVFLGAGGQKLMDTNGEMFARFGYPYWFQVVIGVIEVVGACILLIPAMAINAASLLAIVMLGAVVSSLVAGQPVLPALIVFILVGSLGVLRGDE